VRRYVDLIKDEEGKRDLKFCNNPETPRKSKAHVSTMSSDKNGDNELKEIFSDIKSPSVQSRNPSPIKTQAPQMRIDIGAKKPENMNTGKSSAEKARNLFVSKTY